MATKKKAENKGNVRSVLTLAELPESACIRFGRDLAVTIVLDTANGTLAGTLEIEGNSQPWTADFGG